MPTILRRLNMNKEYTNQQKDAILNIEKITYVGATTHVPMLDLHTNATTNDDYLCVKRIYDTLSQKEKKLTTPISVKDSQQLVNRAILFNTGEPVAFADVIRAENKLWVSPICVDYRYRGRHYGETVLNAVIANLGEVYCRVPNLNTVSLNLVKKNGFEVVQRDWSFTTLKKDNKHD